MYANVTPPPYENVELLKDTPPLSTASVTTESTSVSTDSLSIENETATERGGDSVSLNSESAMAATVAATAASAATAPYSMISDVVAITPPDDAHAADPANTRAVDYSNVRAGGYNDATSALPNRGTVRCSEYEDVQGVARPAAMGEYAGLRGETINGEYVAPYTPLNSETRQACQ